MQVCWWRLLRAWLFHMPPVGNVRLLGLAAKCGAHLPCAAHTFM